jgi:hypothetical protein
MHRTLLSLPLPSQNRKLRKVVDRRFVYFYSSRYAHSTTKPRKIISTGDRYGTWISQSFLQLAVFKDLTVIQPIRMDLYISFIKLPNFKPWEYI